MLLLKTTRILFHLAVLCDSLRCRAYGTFRYGISWNVIITCCCCCTFRWQEERTAVQLEISSRWRVPPNPTNNPTNNPITADAVDIEPGSRGVGMAAPGFVDVYGLELPQRGVNATTTAAASAENVTQDHGKIKKKSRRVEDGQTKGVAEQQQQQQVMRSGSRLVRTPGMESALQAAALGLCQGRPLLVEGPSGSGKTALLEELASLTGNSESCVWLYLDDQMDAKSLLGAYTCTSVPGEFVWQPGPLAQAVCQGRWVVVEALDAAPPDVLAALVPLLESRVLHIPSRGQVLTAAPGFQLFGTITSSASTSAAATAGPGAGPGAAAGVMGASGGGGKVGDLMGGLWYRVGLGAPGVQEQQQILEQLYPVLRPLLPAALATAQLLAVAAGKGGAVAPSTLSSSSTVVTGAPGATSSSAAGGVWGQLVAGALRSGGLRPGVLALQLGRAWGLQDLLKWCRRMEALHGVLLQRGLRRGVDAVQDLSTLDEQVRVAGFTEAADVWSGCVASPEHKRGLLVALAALWALPEQYADQYEERGKPHLTVMGGEVQVRGRKGVVRKVGWHV